MSDVALAILRQARAKIAAPRAWTQGEAARDATGQAVMPRLPSAVCFCPIGACLAAVDAPVTAVNNPAWDAVELLNEAVPQMKSLWLHPVAAWNNQPERTHAEVLALMDRVIAAGEIAGQEVRDNA